MTEPLPRPRPAPGRRSDYRVFLPIATRWMDNDPFGHLNNVVYYSFYDTAVCHFLVTAGILSWKGSPVVMMVAESGNRYHREAAFPDLITAGVRVGRLGTSSVRWEVGVFAGEAEVACAEGFMVHVCVGSADHRPVPMPADWRSRIEAMGA